MVRLQSIALTNFMSIEQLDMQFESNTVVMIGGQNGGGKSAILYAIALALFEYKKGDSYKDFVKVGAPFATVKLQALYNELPISYDLKISTAKYGVPLTRTIQYQGKTYNNSECSQLLKELDSEYLRHAMFLMQNEVSIIDLRPSERAKLLKKVLHFDFDDQVAQLRRTLDTEQRMYSEYVVRLDETKKRKFVPQQLLREVPEETMRALRKNIAKVSKELSTLEAYDPAMITALGASLAKQKDYVATLTGQMDKLEANLSHRSARLNWLQSNKVTLPRAPSTEEMERVDKEVATVRAEMAAKQTELSVLEAEAATLVSQLEVSESGVCHSCGNTITEEHIHKMYASSVKARERCATASNELEALKEAVRDVVKIQRDLESRHSEWQDASAVKNLLEKEEETVSTELDTINVAIAAQKTLLLDAEGELESLRERSREMKETRDAVRRIDTLQQQLSDMEDQLHKAMESKAINKERAKQNAIIKQQSDEHSATVEKLASIVNQTSQNIDVIKRSISIFEVDFPNYIILKTCAHLEGYINGFVQKLFPYMSVRLQPSRSGVEFFYTAESSEEEWLSVKMASGAQAAVLTLAWRVAIARLYGMKAILLDEVDASATEENAAIIYQFIASLDVFDQIIFISHKKEAMETMASLLNNVVCYNVTGGEYSLVEGTV